MEAAFPSSLPASSIISFPGARHLKVISPSITLCPVSIVTILTPLSRAFLASSYKFSFQTPRSGNTIVSIATPTSLLSIISRIPLIWSPSPWETNTQSSFPTPCDFKKDSIRYCPTFFTSLLPPSIKYVFPSGPLIKMQSPCPTSRIVIIKFS